MSPYIAQPIFIDGKVEVFHYDTRMQNVSDFEAVDILTDEKIFRKDITGYYSFRIGRNEWNIPFHIIITYNPVQGHSSVTCKLIQRYKQVYVNGKLTKVEYPPELYNYRLVQSYSQNTDMIEDYPPDSSNLLQSYSQVARKHGFSSIIKMLMLIENSEWLYKLYEGNLLKSITDKSLTFGLEDFLRIRASKNSWSIVGYDSKTESLRNGGPKVMSLAYELCFADELNSNWERVSITNADVRYEYGIFKLDEDILQRAYIILPGNREDGFYNGTWEECLLMLCNEDWLYNQYKKMTETIAKLNAECERKAQAEDSDEYWRSGWQSDYFDAMTDGQMGSYDDFTGNLDDLNE